MDPSFVNAQTKTRLPRKEELLSISQFAACTNIARSALIYYDEIGLLSPAARGEDNGYRYYHSQQIITANFITVLAGFDVPLKTIKELMADRNSAHIRELFDASAASLEERITQLRLSQSLINVFRNLLNMAQEADESRVSICALPHWNFALGPDADFIEGQGFYRPFLQFCDWVTEQGLSTSFPIGGYFTDFASFTAHPGEPDKFFLLLSTNKDSADTHEVLTAYSRGFYGETGDVVERMARVIKQKKLTVTAPVFCLFLEDEISTVDPSKYLMQVTTALQ